MADELKGTRTRLVHSIAEISEAELALRILEAQVGMRRPSGMTAEQALATQPAELRADVRRAAVAAVEYLRECLDATKVVQ